jgi:4-hydroxybenzoate polyprenyltransferase
MALALTLVSAAAFIALAWLFVPLRGNALPGLMAPAFLLILLGYSWTKRFTVLTHWVLGLCLGLAPVGVWVALTGTLRAVGALPLLIGAAVVFWTAGFDILYAIQDMEVDRREGLHSIPARFGRRAAQVIADGSHAVTVGLLGVVLLAGRGPLPALPRPGDLGGPMGLWSQAALAAIGLALLVQHLLARRAAPERIAARFLWLNALVSILWLAGVIADVATYVSSTECP